MTVEDIYSELYGLLYYFIDGMSGAEGEKVLREVAETIYGRMDRERSRLLGVINARTETMTDKDD